MALPDWALPLVSPLDQKMGITLTELTPERVCGTMPVDGNQQPFGLLHGGANGVLIESLASMGAYAHGRPQGRAGVGVDLTVTHVRSARDGVVSGVATALHLGGRLAVYEVKITDERGRLTATGRLTCQMIDLPEP
ncbi:MAG TPA: PaaI family thioesterase [Arachnia sp.]|nr:PaaI family thioesterase [Arachnia sp.]HMT87398.1 PaaI family thioesterase [Arachnia sp.]